MDKTLVYQLYPRAWRGGLKEMEKHLERIASLDVDYVWLSPIYPSPGYDHGYDISDYRMIAPEFGTLEDMDRLIREAGDRGIKIMLDLVVNHSSDEHEWFRKAL